MVSTYRDMSFEEKCILFILGFILLIVASIIDRKKIKNDKYILGAVILTLIIGIVITIGEIARHFSWPPVIITVTLYIDAICLLTIIIILLIRKIRLYKEQKNKR